MRTLIINGILCCLAVATLAIDEHRPKKKVEERGKRNLEYQVSHHYSALPSYRLERRIASLGGQYQNPQYYPRYHKGRPSYPAPPYAVQMEPLVHYSQRDPLYDTNILSLDPQSEDLLTENNQIQDNIDRYGYQKPHIIERPVYIKEPEPIIEIIIKESNVSLPAPPPPPPPPKKKKEQVQVFYVKYKKNPHSSGKDSIIYDKPIPAISPHIPDDEPIEEPAPYYPEHVTAPPPPSTTLRTIIKPDSEYYHSPSGVKVTFGKEGFDYDKRSSKIEDYAPTPIKSPAPQGRQLTSFSNTYFKSPSPTNFQSSPPGFSSNVRQPQPYRTIPPTSSNYKPFGRQTAPAPITPPQNYPFQSSPSAPFSSFSQPSPPQFGHSVSHPPPPRFQSASKPSLPQIRQPVPYKPFDNLRPQQSFAQTPAQRPPIQFRPETHFPIQQQLPLQDDNRNFNSPRYQLNSGEVQTRQPIQYQKLPNQALPSFRPPQAQPQFSPKFQQPDFQHNFNRPQITIPQPQQQPFQHQSIAPAPPSSHFQQPQLNIAQQFRQTPQQLNPQQHQQQINPQQHQQQTNQQHQHHTNPPQHQQHSNPQQQNFQSQLLPQQHQQQGFLSQQPLSQNDHLKNLQSAQNILPPGGQLIPSVSKYESHITSVEPTVSVQGLSPQQYQQKIIQQFNQNSLSQEQTSQELLNRQQTRSHEASKEILTRQQTSSQYTNQFAHHQDNSLPQYNTQDSLSRQQNLLRQQNEELLKRQQSNVEQQKKLLQDIQLERERQNSIQHYFSKPNSGDVGPQQNAGDSQKKLYEEIERQRYQQEQLRQFYQQNPDIKHSAVDDARNSQQPTFNQEYQKPTITNSVSKEIYVTTTSTTTTPAPSTPPTTTKDPKILEAQLPDEVPEDLRQQLLSSGILNHADISVLDYDKVGDIPISALPPDQLANFYGAGGAAQLESGSDPVPSVVRKDGTVIEKRAEYDSQEPEPAASELVQKVVASPLVAEPSGVEMKVVRYDPDTDKGQQVQEKYVEDEAYHVDPVVLNDNSYNRYLPLKINGTQFPIPDVPELKGKRISSVVVLAPVNFDFSAERKTREATGDSVPSDMDLIEGTALKELLVNPSMDNFRRFLENENKTTSAKQSVILLIADSPSKDKQQEIFMYDVATQTVSKLSGELSSAFVEAAEANSNESGETAEASNAVEKRVPYSGNADRRESKDERDLEDDGSEVSRSKVPIIDPLQEEDMETQASQNIERFVDISGRPIKDLSFSSSNSHQANFISQS